MHVEKLRASHEVGQKLAETKLAAAEEKVVKMKNECLEVERGATDAITDLHQKSTEEYTALLSQHSELERHVAKTQRERQVYDQMASSTGLVANDLGDSPAAVSMAQQVITRIMATVERMTNENGQNAIVQAMARMPAEILPGNPALAEDDQVAPDGFGLSEQQLKEHADAKKRQHERDVADHHWQNIGWYEWWSMPVPETVTPRVSVRMANLLQILLITRCL